MIAGHVAEHTLYRGTVCASGRARTRELRAGKLRLWRLQIANVAGIVGSFPFTFSLLAANVIDFVLLHSLCFNRDT